MLGPLLAPTESVSLGAFGLADPPCRSGFTRMLVGFDQLELPVHFPPQRKGIKVFLGGLQRCLVSAFTSAQAPRFITAKTCWSISTSYPQLSSNTACRWKLNVDCCSLFLPEYAEALTQLQAALHFYEVSFRYALSPRAYGKIERQHLYWQRRLLALFAAVGITTSQAAEMVVPKLRRNCNAHEVHRQLGRTVQCCRPGRQTRAPQRGATGTDRAPRDRWPYIWSVRAPVKVAQDGRLPVGHQRLRLSVAAGTRVIHCVHPGNAISILRHEPKASEAQHSCSNSVAI